VSTPASILSSVAPTLCMSSFASAQKQPWALRYSGQMPGWTTYVPLGGSVKTSFLNMILHAASIRSGATSRINAAVAGLFGSDVTWIGTSGGDGG